MLAMAKIFDPMELEYNSEGRDSVDDCSAAACTLPGRTSKVVNIVVKDMDESALISSKPKVVFTQMAVGE